jgi:hypothetical protein
MAALMLRIQRRKTMLGRSRLFGLSLLLLSLTVAVSATTWPSYSFSATGQIADSSEDVFSIFTNGNDGHIILSFMVGPMTRIDGELKVGASANVEYVSLGSCNLALHVVAGGR